jgi:hypothetical protein
MDMEQDLGCEIRPIWDGVTTTFPMETCSPFENQRNSKYLSKCFKPTSWDVVSDGSTQQCRIESLFVAHAVFKMFLCQICARGDTSFDHIGNRRLRVLVASYLPSYVVAESRSDRSQIRTEIVRCANDAGGIFVRFDRSLGLWYNIGETGAVRRVFHVINYRLSRIASAKCNGNGDATEFVIRKIQDDLLWSSIHPKVESYRQDQNHPLTSKGESMALFY